MATEDPTPGQAVTGSIPAASLVNISTIRQDQDRFFLLSDGEMCFIFQQTFVSQICPNEMRVNRMEEECVRESVASDILRVRVVF